MNRCKANGSGSLFQLIAETQSRRTLTIVLVLNTLTVVCSCFSPLVQRSLIDTLDMGKQTAWIYLAVLAVLILSQRCGVSLLSYLKGKISIAIRTELKERMFRHLLNLPAGFLKERGPGYFFNRLQIDVAESAGFVSHGAAALFENALKCVLATATILFLQWRCGLLVLPFVLAQLLICLFFRRRQYRLSHRICERTAEEQYRMQTMLDNHVLLKTHADNEKSAGKIRRGLSAWGGLMQLRLRNELWFRMLLQFPVWSCCALVTIIGMHGVLQRHWTLGELWAVVGLVFLIFNPIRQLGENFLQTQSAFAAWKRLTKLLSTDMEGGDSPARKAESLVGDIEFVNLDFSYPGGTTILRHFNLKIRQGEICYLTGRNGSGKSTVLALLLRLYEPNSGVIRIGGKPISEYETASYRTRIGYIGQRPEFLPGTVRDLLQPANGLLADEILDSVLKNVGLAQRLRDSGGLNSRVSENADNFSGGERLRLALARELLRKTDILIFDEATANLDTEGERCFEEQLRSAATGKTMLIVTHRPPEADTLVVDLSALKNSPMTSTISIKQDKTGRSCQ